MSSNPRYVPNACHTLIQQKTASQKSADVVTVAKKVTLLTLADTKPIKR